MIGSPVPPGYFLTTDRLGFRCWRPEDTALATELWGDPAVARFISAGGVLSPPAVSERLAREIGLQAEHGFQYWPIFLRRGADHVGCCGLRPYRIEEGVHELGVHIRPAFWRQGLALQAARGVIDYAFDVLKARGLFAGHSPDNASSREMIRKLGFRYTHDELYPPTGRHHPSYLLTR
jgi:RimJ/RimL family protein N-acetyltransferase